VVKYLLAVKFLAEKHEMMSSSAIAAGSKMKRICVFQCDHVKTLGFAQLSSSI
jgi:hypothetical protein